MKKILIALFMLCMCNGFYAQNVKPRLVVWQKSGQKVYFVLSEEPRTTFVKDKIVITTSTMTTEYYRSNVLRYTYEGTISEIETVGKNECGVVQTGDDISLRGLAQNTLVQLYDGNGRLLKSCMADGSGPVEFSLEGRVPGVYILKCNGQSYKFVKR